MQISGFFALCCCKLGLGIVIMKLKEKGGIISMKRLISVFMAMLLFCLLSIPVSVQADSSEETGSSASEPSETTVSQPDTSATEPVPENPGDTPSSGPEETTTQPTVPSATEPIPETPRETTAPVLDPEVCDHSWMYVEVDPTCTEYGGKGYVCIYCEALRDLEAINMVPHTYEDSCDSDCNVCGSVRLVTHKYSSAWSKNSTQHWHACSVCGAKSDTGSHYPGPAATEEKAQYCLTCGLMMMPKKDHSHQYSTTYTFNETEHWYACKGCEVRKASEPHSYDNPCDSSCNICGHTSVKKHDYGTWTSDRNGHWKICSLCGATTEPEPHVADTKLTETKLCGICSHMLSVESVHAHAWSDSWSCDESTHWKQCECGEKTETEPHIWDEGRENGDAVMQYACTACGAGKSETIPQEPASAFWWIPAGIVILCSLAIGMAILVLVKLKARKQ